MLGMSPNPGNATVPQPSTAGPDLASRAQHHMSMAVYEQPALQQPAAAGPHLRETLGSVYFLFCCILFVLVFLSLGRTKLHFRHVGEEIKAKHHTHDMRIAALEHVIVCDANACGQRYYFVCSRTLRRGIWAAASTGLLFWAISFLQALDFGSSLWDFGLVVGAGVRVQDAPCGDAGSPHVPIHPYRVSTG